MFTIGTLKPPDNKKLNIRASAAELQIRTTAKVQVKFSSDKISVSAAVACVVSHKANWFQEVKLLLLTATGCNV